jgi:hypothetical protein
LGGIPEPGEACVVVGGDGQIVCWCHATRKVVPARAGCYLGGAGASTVLACLSCTARV